MSTELKAQIRHLASEAEAGQRPVTVDEVLARLGSRDDTDPLVKPAEGESVLSRGPWPAVVAAAVVLVIFGVFAWVFPNDEVPPADTLPDLVDRELGNYVTTAVPEGFVLQDVRIPPFSGRGSVLYLRDVGATWLPGDGGFQIEEPFGSPFALPEDPNEYIGQILDFFPGSREVSIAGQPGVIYETEFADGPVTTDLISLLVVDSRGGVFEVTATGMSIEDVITVAEDVERVPVGDLVELGSNLTWDLRVDTGHESFQHVTSQAVLDVASDIQVVLGTDLFTSQQFAWPEQEETTVITTDDGSVVESADEDSDLSTSGRLYFEVPEGSALDVREALRGQEIFPDLSPNLERQLTRDYIDLVRPETVLSEDPYVIQASAGPEPQFDTSSLGQEIPLVPATSVDEVPFDTAGSGFPESQPVATREYPVVAIGTASQPDSDSPGIDIQIYFTEAGGFCHAFGSGRSCGGLPLDQFGVASASYTDTGEGEVLYVVPLDTSVVQVVTEEGSFWQRPIAGHGLVPYGDAVGQPTSIISFDDQGDELGEWEIDLD